MTSDKLCPECSADLTTKQPYGCDHRHGDYAVWYAWNGLVLETAVHNHVKKVGELMWFAGLVKLDSVERIETLLMLK